ncbi:MAG: RodZ domain-containing protein [Sulfitobacter sp.]|jgi:cytoskeletal protein RodZ|uniref:helix-turn-helix domain-containing protein n=1 Tax=Sulfitobacter sp. TaxID=1903071 RepID=UPI000C0F247F|nr:helix-turn-helix domain-containing protein [Roseobacter sp.]MBV47161.1 helix-turn-helix domain-containing protein [Roseobacter sp.]PHR09761.1 MAG: helix-turn-helix domain-containing protein [Sulfitobacter sp.]|tara:strand:- start:15977 stop:17239 length:1263 start_codon:yes stop_codon:yes gene_type:complete
MIGRWASKSTDDHQVEAKGFDAFDLRLGDLMRGERATLGKSLLDVQRELRIKASYIAAIENSDPDAFDTPGFIAGYVRSYARYLNMDPDAAFTAFCKESGFSVAHGMSAEASVVKKPTREERMTRTAEVDIFKRPSTPFTPVGDSFLGRIEPGAVGSVLVLVALIGAIGFGGWSVLKEVQRVQVSPVDETPVVLSDLDPLDGALASAPEETPNAVAPSAMSSPRADALDRLYRPAALDVPVLVARDAPISSIDPRSVGSFTSTMQGLTVAENDLPQTDQMAIDAAVSAVVNSDPGTIAVPQVVEGPAPALRMVAAYPSWVRVRAADGKIIFEGIMNKGDSWEVPATEEPPTLRTGESGAIYFAMDGQYFGPVGDRGAVTSNLPLQRQALAELYEPALLKENSALATMVAELQNAAPSPTE